MLLLFKKTDVVLAQQEDIVSFKGKTFFLGKAGGIALVQTEDIVLAQNKHFSCSEGRHGFG